MNHSEKKESTAPPEIETQRLGEINKMSKADQLLKLAELKNSGELSEEEYQTAKTQVLESNEGGKSKIPGFVFEWVFGLAVFGLIAYFAVPYLLGLGENFKKEANKTSEKMERAQLLLGKGSPELGMRPSGGFFSYSVFLINEGDDVLLDTTLEIVALPSEGKEFKEKKYWERWNPGEEKELQFSKSKVGSQFAVIVSGFATVESDEGREKVQLAKTWTFEKKSGW